MKTQDVNGNRELVRKESQQWEEKTCGRLRMTILKILKLWMLDGVTIWEEGRGISRNEVKAKEKMFGNGNAANKDKITRYDKN